MWTGEQVERFTWRKWSQARAPLLEALEVVLDDVLEVLLRVEIRTTRLLDLKHLFVVRGELVIPGRPMQQPTVVCIGQVRVSLEAIT